MPPANTVIVGDEALATFRLGLTGARAVELLQEARGRLLVQLPVGVGKTEWMATIIDHVLQRGGEIDGVVALLPRRDVLRELRARLPKSLRPKILTSRPRARCGDLDAEWRLLEQNGCARLGRAEQCGICPHLTGCAWPKQFRQIHARLILATQQHLILNPFFIDQLCQHAGAGRPLTLIDESDILLRPCERVVRRSDLAKFIAALEGVISAVAAPPTTLADWLTMSRAMQSAGNDDLRGRAWDLPADDYSWSVVVQKRGREMFGPTFRYLGYELRHFTRSDVASRERLPDGCLRFAVPPHLGDNFIVFSGSIAPELARYRLDPSHTDRPLFSPFKNLQFEHPGTRWYNLAMPAGTASSFPGNAPRILAFFATLIARNISAGKRTLLVVRKSFRRLAQTFLQARLGELVDGGVKIVVDNWARHNLTDPRTIALITYGVSGVNRFQHVECAFCVSGYYVPPIAIEQTIYDIDPFSDRFPLALSCKGNPPRRRVAVQLPDDRQTILPWVASEVLVQKEADVVVQAVGRVRPFTKPREVITMHMGELPGVRFNREFNSLAEARAYFNVPLPSAAALRTKTEEARRLRALGYTIKATAAEMGVSRSSVKRYLKGPGVHGAL